MSKRFRVVRGVGRTSNVLNTHPMLVSKSSESSQIVSIRQPEAADALICFTLGTGIQTPNGERRIESLRPGDLVQTLDNGAVPLRWVGSKRVRASGALAPICFEKGVIGNYRDLLVSPRHRMLCGGSVTRTEFGQAEVLAPAKSLIDNFRVTQMFGGMVTYIHMLFDSHQVVIANGAASESFLPVGTGLDALSVSSREDLFSAVPHLRDNASAYGPASRACLTPEQSEILAIA